MANPKTPEGLVDQLTLLLLYLTSWEERGVVRAWKNHRFESLDALSDLDLIDQGRKGTKSVYLTKDGLEVARQLVNDFVGELVDHPV